ncbi:MAG: S1 RNA-binding domain-containing protein [bacterium]|nr:S1 RNA-binding domain-containing protein [bacterium]
MSEGTKLGTLNDKEEIKDISSSTGIISEVKGTKLGEISDFEKSLFIEEAIEEESNKKEEDLLLDETLKARESDNNQETPDKIEFQENAEVTKNIETAKPVSQQEIPAAAEISLDTYTEEKKSDEESKKEKITALQVKTAKSPASSEDIFQKEMDQLDIDFREGDIIKGTVRAVEKFGIYVDFGYKSDGLVSSTEFYNENESNSMEKIKTGDDISVYILKLESKEGYTILSAKRAEYELAWNSLDSAQKSRNTIEVFVTSKVQGGLVASYKGIKGFIPASQVVKEGDEVLETFVNSRLDVNVIQVDRKRRKVIFSAKTKKTKSKKEAISKIMETIEVGQVISGKVTCIKDFGAFIDIGGIEGLAHISELSWSRVNHPSELLKTGQTINVFILGIDKEHIHISLGMKQLEPDPWVQVADKYSVSQVITGTISRIVPFGAFIKIDDKIEGLIHISELSYNRVDKVSDVVSIGLKVQAKIIKLIPEEQKIGLSLKGIHTEDNLNPAASEDSKEDNIKKDDEKEAVKNEVGINI